MLLIATAITNLPRPPTTTTPQSTTNLPFITTMKDIKEKKMINTNSGVGYDIKVKVREMEENKRWVITSSMSKEVVCCVCSVVGNVFFVIF